MTDNQLHQFFEDLVRTLRSRGVICAITSGLACVHYGVAETTQDCDLLCHPGAFDALLNLLAETEVSDLQCHYRGHISPPLDARWHRGGWTSHFQWGTGTDAITLDVFGHASRESSPWQDDISGLYASENVVAEMKRTDRDKDWPFITSLGVALLRGRDPRGWLHLFDADTIGEMLEAHTVPEEMLAVRPTLELAVRHDPALRHALMAEQHFWKELDRIRIRIFRAALRPYVAAMIHENAARKCDLQEEHGLRLACAQRTLEPTPLSRYGVDRMIEQARESTATLINPDLLRWLPDVRPQFRFLAS